MAFRIPTLGVISALLLAFLQAPESHVHEHDSTQHHLGGFFHTHFLHLRTSHSTHPEIRPLDPDDDAVFQHWFFATQNAPQVLHFILCAIPLLPPPVQSEWRAEIIRPSSHDPPGLAILPPRSPPV
ncbi:MAG TPA: hypothetical protein VK604_01490 [Bryobacteraceae bacterium]|nr:hypothetical protein [Bryobacteraceae bacterium]